MLTMRSTCYAAVAVVQGAAYAVGKRMLCSCITAQELSLKAGTALRAGCDINQP